MNPAPTVLSRARGIRIKRQIAIPIGRAGVRAKLVRLVGLNERPVEKNRVEDDPALLHWSVRPALVTSRRG